MFSGTGHIVRKSHARAEILVVVMREFGIGASDRLQLLECAAVLDSCGTDQVKVLIPTKSQVQGQPIGYLPIVLEVKTQLLHTQQELGIATARRHAPNQAWS